MRNAENFVGVYVGVGGEGPGGMEGAVMSIWRLMRMGALRLCWWFYAGMERVTRVRLRAVEAWWWFYPCAESVYW